MLAQGSGRRRSVQDQNNSIILFIFCGKIQVMNTDPEFELLRAAVFELYDGHCALCYHRTPITTHEEPPRSLNPRWKREPWTWYPLCGGCHTHVHNISRSSAIIELDVARVKYFSHIKDQIDELIK